MLTSVTRLRVRSLKYLPAFLWMTLLSQRQVVRAPGFVGGGLLMDAGWTFWTLTSWESERAMKVFRGAGPHAKVMSRLVEWCDEASYAHWIPAGASVPSWREAYEHLVAEGKVSRVAHLPVMRLGISQLLCSFLGLAQRVSDGILGGSRYPLINSVGALGGFAGPYMIGAVAMRTGSLYAGLAITRVALFISATLVLLLPPKARAPAKG
jgi:hypothetical protein